MDTREAELSPDEAENVAVVIRPKTRRNFVGRRSLVQSLNMERVGIPRQEYPTAIREGKLDAAKVEYH
jgi:hypothetical protein